MKIYVPIKTCTQMCKASLFIIATKWKQCKYLWISECIQSAVYTYNGILLSNKKEWTVPIHEDVLQTVPIYCKSLMLRERNQTQKFYTYDYTYMTKMILERNYMERSIRDIFEVIKIPWLW